MPWFFKHICTASLTWKETKALNARNVYENVWGETSLTNELISHTVQLKGSLVLLPLYRAAVFMLSYANGRLAPASYLLYRQESGINLLSALQQPFKTMSFPATVSTIWTSNFYLKQRWCFCFYICTTRLWSFANLWGFTLRSLCRACACAGGGGLKDCTSWRYAVQSQSQVLLTEWGF